MKSKTKQRVMASVLALLMTISLLPVDFLGGNVVAKAESTTHSFVAENETAITSAEKKGAIADGTTFADGYFTVVGTATRANSSTFSLELAKEQTGALQFTTTGLAKVTFTVGSTSGSNTTDGIVLTDADGNTYSESTGLSSATGTDPTTLVYENLPAGTYKFMTTASRGLRVYTATVEETAAVASKTSSFVAENETAITSVDKKAAIAEGTTFADGYFTVVGTATRANSSTFSLELAKEQTGALQFTTTGTAKATFTVGSTSGSNTTDGIVLTDADGNTYPESTGLSSATGTDPTTLVYENLPAGTYKFATTASRGLRVYTATVEEQGGSVAPPTRPAWDTVALPVINSVTRSAAGTLDVDVTATIGFAGADSARLFMYQNGFEVSNVQVTKSGVYSFTPATEGDFTFKVIMSRKECADKESAVVTFTGYTLPLDKPVITWVNNLGNGSVYVDWNNLEAVQSYEVYYKAEGTSDFTCAATGITAGNYTIEGLTSGTKYDIKVVANKEGFPPAEYTETGFMVGDAAQQWYIAAFGSATSGKMTVNGTEYAVKTDTGVTPVANVTNTDGTVYIAPADNGKIADSEDGFFYYYTKINPNTENFKLTATFTVKDISLGPDNQTAYGIYATDIAGYGSKDAKYFNSVSIGQMKMYLNGYHAHGAKLVTGYTSYDASNNAGAVRNFNNTNVFSTKNELDTVNVGDTFTYTLEKTNEGYSATMKGETISFDGATSLMAQEDGSICVGVMTARKVGVEISNIQFEKSEGTASASSGLEIVPKFTVFSGATASSAEYEFIASANVGGWLDVYDATGTKVFAEYIEADKVVKVPITLTNIGGFNGIRYAFAPDKNIPNLSSYREISATIDVIVQSWGAAGETIYVAPNGKGGASGTENDPLDLQTALNYAQPGQVIVMLDGTYYPEKDYVIPRSVNGTAEKPITLMAQNTGKAIIDGSKMESSSSLISVVGSYWHVYGLEVCNGLAKGVSVCGSYNTIEMCVMRANGNSGLQISRYAGEPNDADMWPAYNLIKYCEAYDNCDPGRNDADGFAAKLTCGEGNKFYGCISHNNIDDGWDLYAKSTTGPIGAVTIENCVAYSNGFLSTDDPTDPNTAFGEGNGFKLGGENMPGAHKLINSISYNNYAKGITSNSGPDCQVINCTAYNNSLKGGSYNVSLYTKTSNPKAWVLDGMLSVVDNSTTAAELGSSNGVIYSLRSATNYLYDGTQSTNTQGVAATSDWFVSTDVTIKPTITESGIDMHGLLVLKDSAPANTGARMNFAGSESVQPTVTTTVSGKISMQIVGFTPVAIGKGNGVNTGDTTPVMPLVIIMIVSAGICGAYVFRRKRA